MSSVRISGIRGKQSEGIENGMFQVKSWGRTLGGSDF